MNNPESPRVIGLDIGGSKIMAGLVNSDGRILRALSTATASTAKTILTDARQLCSALINDSANEVIAIGIGSAGIVDPSSGTVIHANDNLPDWTGTRLSALNVASLPIIAENDARALAYGEAILGAGKTYTSLLCLTVGTGIGAGLIIDGQVWHGANSCAGEIGYLLADWDGDRPIILDQFASGPGIERAYQTAAGIAERRPLHEISRRARSGERLATEIIQAKARKLGLILGGFAASFNPNALVIGGGVPQIGPLWQDPFECAFRDAVPPLMRSTAILPAALGVEAVLLGAAMLAWRKLRP